MKLSGIIAGLFALVLSAAPALSSEAFPEFPKSRPLCSEHVSGQPFHVQWKSFGSSAEVQEVLAFFESKMNLKAKPGGNESFLITHPKDPDLVLTVYPRTAAEKFPGCGKKPEASDQTILLISQAIR